MGADWPTEAIAASSSTREGAAAHLLFAKRLETQESLEMFPGSYRWKPEVPEEDSG